MDAYYSSVNDQTMIQQWSFWSSLKYKCITKNHFSNRFRQEQFVFFYQMFTINMAKIFFWKRMFSRLIFIIIINVFPIMFTTCWNCFLYIKRLINLLFIKGTSWSWSYGSWIFNYLCNQYHHYRCEFEPCSWWGVLDTI